MRSTVVACKVAFAGLVLWTVAGPGGVARERVVMAGGQQQEIQLRISGDAGARPRYAVPDFLAVTPDAETVAAARLIGQVLWDDLAFEREFDMIPRDTYATIPAARSLADVPFERWRELGADALVIGTVTKTGDQFRVEARLFQVRDRRPAMGKEYTGPASNPRLFAHTLADEIHQAQVGLRGVARTKIAFTSDRDGDRISGPVEERTVKEIYIVDYDGANARRVTTTRGLNATPAWSPDGRAIGFTSWRRGSPDLYIASIYQALPPETPARGQGNNYFTAWSPDGTQIAFMSSRDGNPELYVMNRDGSNVRRLTNHPAGDSSPAWSPTGLEIAFVSDRSGTPQIYVVGADGRDLRRITSESYCDRPTWSPAPHNEIAYAARSGPGFDIRIFDRSTGEVRSITNGEGSNESPSYAANGRHLVFSSNRNGRMYQLFTVGRDGRGLRQLTRTGNNQMPDWSR
jgi:TolB protein